MQSRNVVPGVPNTRNHPFECCGEIDPYFPERNLRISGVTRDATGTPLAGCTVHCLRSDTDEIVDRQVSDASGNFFVTIPVGLSQTQTVYWYLVAYLAGSPDRAGTTVNTLQGSQTVPAVIVSYILSDDFEETNSGGSAGTSSDGYDDAQYFSASGTTDPDYATSPAPLLGSQSLKVSADSFSRYILTGSQTEIDGFCLFNIPAGLPITLPSEIIEIQDNSGNVMFSLYVRTDGAVQCLHGSDPSAQTTGLITSATTIALWWHWKTDGTGSVAWANYTGSQTRPSSGSNFASVTGGNGTTAMQRILIRAANGGRDIVFDRLRLTAGTTIPDNP